MAFDFIWNASVEIILNNNLIDILTLQNNCYYSVHIKCKFNRTIILTGSNEKILYKKYFYY